MSFENVLSPLWAITTFLFVYVYIKAEIKQYIKFKPARIVTYFEIILSIYLFRFIGIIFVVILILPPYILVVEHTYYKLKKSLREKNPGNDI